MSENREIKDVRISKAENGLIVHATWGPKDFNPILSDDVKTDDELSRWHMEAELTMRQEVKTYVFSDYDSMSQFVKIQTGW